MRELLEKRCRRCIAIVLSANEKEDLTSETRSRLRKVVLDQFNDFAALAIDVVESTERGSVINELWLEKMDELLAHFTSSPRGLLLFRDEVP